MPIGDAIYMAAVVFAAGFVRSFSGFGFALVAVPLLSIRLPLTFVVPAILVFDLVTGVVLTANKGARYRDPIIYILFAGMLVGAVIGTRALVSLPEAGLKAGLGAGIAAYGVWIALGRPPARRRAAARTMAGAAGLASGTLGGMFGTSGPPLVVYLRAYTAGDKTDFRARMLVILFLENLWRTALYAYEGLYTGRLLASTVVLIPVLLAALWVGSHVHARVSERTFARVIGTLLAVSGCSLLLR